MTPPRDQRSLGTRGTGPAVAVTCAVLGLACLTEQTIAMTLSSSVGPLVDLDAAGLGVFAGAVLGLVLKVVLTVVTRLRRAGAFLVWLACFGAGAGWVLREIDAFTKLAGVHHNLAVLAIGAFGGASVILAGLATFHAPGQRRLALLFAIVAAGLTLVDRGWFVDNYPPVHDVLRIGAALCLALALLAAADSAPPRRALRPVRVSVTLGAVLLGALPLLTLTGEQQDKLHELLARPYSGLALRLARAVTDLDLDGSSHLLGGGDCAPFNRHIGPKVPEIPGNGIDDNCQFGDAPLPGPRVREADIPLPASPSPVSVVLVTIETLRADHLGLYGYRRPTSPRLDAWAHDALVFDRAYTTGGVTFIAGPSLLRGLYPRRLVYTIFEQTNLDRSFRLRERVALPRGEQFVFRYGLPVDDPAVPFPRLLQRRGMVTRSATGFGVPQSTLGGRLTEGCFDEWRDVAQLAPERRDDSGTTDLAIELLRSMPRDRRFFMWVHYYGPHAPNQHHAEAPTFGEAGIDGYDHEIAWADAQVGRFLDALDAAVPRANLAVIITGDHGEQFVDQWSRQHGFDLEDGSIHVPLLVRAPGLAAGRVDAPVSLVDLAPTILALTHTPAPPDLDGVDLTLPIAPRTIIADTWRVSPTGRLELDFVAVIAHDGKLIHDRLNHVTIFDGRRPDPAAAAALELTLARYLDETAGAPRFRE